MENRLAAVFLLGSLAIFLGFSPVLDDLTREFRNFNAIGTPQPVHRPRKPEPVSRFERLCFIASGVVVIAIGLLAALFTR